MENKYNDLGENQLKPENVVNSYITREFMVRLNKEVIKTFNLSPYFLLGDMVNFGGFYASGGFHTALEVVSKEFNCEGLIEHLEKMDWWDYDLATSHIEFTCAKRFGLYTPKYRIKTLLRIASNKKRQTNIFKKKKWRH